MKYWICGILLSVGLVLMASEGPWFPWPNALGVLILGSLVAAWR